MEGHLVRGSFPDKSLSTHYLFQKAHPREGALLWLAPAQFPALHPALGPHQLTLYVITYGF